MDICKNNKLNHLSKILELEILEVAHASLGPEWNFKNVSYRFSQLYVPTKGFGQLLLETETIDLKPGNIYIIPAGLQYSCHCDGHLEKYLVDFCLSFPDKTDILTGKRHVILQNKPEVSNRIVSASKNHDPLAVLKLKSALYECLSFVPEISSYSNLDVPSYTFVTQSALAYINANLSAQLTIEQIANAHFISKLTLQRHFKADIGVSIGKYVDQRLLAKAEYYLMNPTMTIKEISEILGFSDQFYFSKKFTQHHGINPSAYKRLYKK